MGSILNFIVPDTNLYKKFGLNSSVIFYAIEYNTEIIKSYNFEILNNAKNILLLETDLNLTFIYKEVDGEKVLDKFPIEFIKNFNNSDSKILISCIAEATKFRDDIYSKILEELNRFSIDINNVYFIDSNNLYKNYSKNFYISNYFLKTIHFDPYIKNYLNYYSSIPSVDDVLSNSLRKKHFLSYNRNMDRIHRVALACFIEKNNLWNKFTISVLKKISDSTFYNIQTYFNEYFDFISILNKKIPIEIDTQFENDKGGFPTSNLYDKKNYLESYFHVVTETEIDNDKIFFTEKILKPIMGLQPFIVLSSKNYLLELKKLGFKTFDLIWDESYDSVENEIDRIKKCLFLIKDISNWSLEKCDAKYKSVLDICIYNRNHLFNIQDKNELLNIIKEIENEW